MKKFAWLLAIPLLLLWSIQAQAFNIYIHQYIEHPSLQNAVDGFRDVLKESGLEVSITEENAQNDTVASQMIVSKIIGAKPDLVLTVGTMTSVNTVNKIKDIPILFTAVTDPVDAQLVASLEKPGANVTGTTDMTPLADQIDLIRQVQPDVKKIGVIFNPGEANSRVQVDLVLKAAQTMGLTIQEAVASDNAGVYSAAQNLVDRVDAIFLPTDNTVISSYESVLQVTTKRNIPVYPAEADSLKKGGTAAISLSYYELGRQTGHMAVKILKGEAKPSDIPVETQDKFDLYVNSDYNEKIGLKVPQAVLDRAKEINADNPSK
ncbi:MAG: ABC transporter substrate-binding protein [Deltaproteobacteria bacterium]|jgi:putative ABC transport system substrate-binding protein|nr:ABC transporter substrate-binding protein [Deltaproteobacteria bacterium]